MCGAGNTMKLRLNWPANVSYWQPECLLGVAGLHVRVSLYLVRVEFLILGSVHVQPFVPEGSGTEIASMTLLCLIELSQLSTYRSPRDKVTCVMNCCTVVCSKKLLMSCHNLLFSVSCNLFPFCRSLEWWQRWHSKRSSANAIAKCSR